MLNSKLMMQWHPTRNPEMDPKILSDQSRKKAWWLCEKGHEWKAIISNRGQGKGCPICAGRQVLEGDNDLATRFPGVAAQWHHTRNGNLGPESVTAMSGRKVWWMCEKGHEWQAVIAARSCGSGCPVCAGKKVQAGYNDLATVCPDLAKEWHTEKNGELTPECVTKGSNKKVWWRCKRGHEWQATISSRSAGCGCFRCNSGTSFAEQVLYFYIKQLYRAENQYRGFKKELDIYLPDFSIGIEHDGPLHRRQKVKEADERKDLLMKEHGVLLIRVKDIFPSLTDEKNDIIYYTYQENDHTGLTFAVYETLRLIAERTGEKRIPEINIERDRNSILKQYKIMEEEKSIFNQCEDAKRYWDYEKNVMDPLYVSSGSMMRIYWKCSYGHGWSCSAREFTKGARCPTCQGRRVLLGFNDLATLKPELAEEWHPERNGALGPDQVTTHAGKKVWWRCREGHEWKTSVANRSDGSGCPVCSRKRLLTGFNDLKTLRGELAAEWHPEKNGKVGPDAVAVMTGKKAWWRCEKGHEWKAVISSRASGAACPYCSGKRVWKGFNDLATLNPELAAQWHPKRNGELTAEDVTEHSGKRVWWQCERGHEWPSTVSGRSRGHGCPYCSGRLAIPGETDFGTIFPEIAAQWHPTKNETLRPEDVMCMSERKVWWRCERGHHWEAAVCSRARGSGCPYCSGRWAIRGYNDLFTARPELQDEWDDTKNHGIDPYNLLSHSNKKIWWRCKYGHEWQAPVYSRTAGRGCPVCAGKQVLPGWNDLATLRPDLARSWNVEKMGEITPQEVTVHSRKKVWWRCEQGHEWKTAVYNRTYGTGCPVCYQTKRKKHT